MKKFVFEAAKKQWEKPTEPKYVFCCTAKATVIAEDEAKAKALAEEKLKKEYCGSGTILGEVKFVASYDLPVDWSYGYGDQRKSGDTASIGDLVGNHMIR